VTIRVFGNYNNEGWVERSLNTIGEYMENTTLVANALTRGCHTMDAQAGIAYQYDETPGQIAKMKAEREKQETFYRKQRRAAAIVSVAEALVTVHAVNPNQALTTAEDFFIICEAFMAKETETSEA